MFPTLSWILLVLYAVSRARAQDDCLHPFSEQEIEECVGETFPFGPDPHGFEPQPHSESATTANPPHAAFPTTTAASPTVTRTSKGNTPTQQLSPAHSESQSHSDPSPSTTSPVSAAMNTESQTPASTPPSSGLSSSSIATPESAQAINGRSHPEIGLILGILVPILTLLVMASVFLYRRRRVRRTKADTISPLSIPPTRRSAAVPRPFSTASDAYSFETSPARYSTEKRPHSLIFMPMMSYDGETDRETYNPPSTPRSPPIRPNTDPDLEFGEHDHNRNFRRVSNGRFRSFIEDRYGVLPSTGHGHSATVGTDEQLPPYPPPA